VRHHHRRPEILLKKGIDEFNTVNGELYGQFLRNLYAKKTAQNSDGGATITAKERQDIDNKIAQRTTEVKKDIKDFNIGEYKLNVVLDDLYTTKPPSKAEQSLFEKIITEDGRELYVDKVKLNIIHDKIELIKSVSPDVDISFVLLTTGNTEKLKQEGEREAKNSNYVLPDTSNPETAADFKAITGFVTDEFSAPDPSSPTEPLVKNWILHNEIDANTTWCDAGQGVKTMDEYMSRYMHQLGLLDNALTNASERNGTVKGRPFIPTTRSWTVPHGDSPNFAVRDMLDWIAQNEQTTGRTIDWGLAYHPYGASPQSNKNSDDPQHAGPNADHVDASNIWVLMNYLSNNNQYVDDNGQSRERSVMFAEQGYRSGEIGDSASAWRNGTPPAPDATDQEILDSATDGSIDQAESILFALTQTVLYPNIEAYHYHRYHDNNAPGEDKDKNYGLLDQNSDKKLAGYLFEDLDVNLSIESLFDPSNEIIVSLWAGMGITNIGSIKTPADAAKALNSQFGLQLPVPQADH